MCDIEGWGLDRKDPILNVWALRELQQINYPILWGGHPARPMNWAGRMPTPQEIVGYFFTWKSLRETRGTCGYSPASSRAISIFAASTRTILTGFSPW